MLADIEGDFQHSFRRNDILYDDGFSGASVLHHSSAGHKTMSVSLQYRSERSI